MDHGVASPHEVRSLVFVFGPSGPARGRKRSLTWSSARDVNLFLTKKDDFYANSAHRSAHGDHEEPCYAARFSLTIGRYRRLSWKLTIISNGWPGFPATSAWGLAQGELRGQPSRGSILGLRLPG